MKACRGIHLVLSRSGREGVELFNFPYNIKIGGHEGVERAERFDYPIKSSPNILARVGSLGNLSSFIFN